LTEINCTYIECHLFEHFGRPEFDKLKSAARWRLSLYSTGSQRVKLSCNYVLSHVTWSPSQPILDQPIHGILRDVMLLQRSL